VEIKRFLGGGAWGWGGDLVWGRGEGRVGRVGVVRSGGGLVGRARVR